jgi:hypothetical protein
MHLDNLRFSYHGSAILYCKRIAELPFQNKFVPDNFVRWQKHPRARTAEFLSIHATLGIPSPRARTTNKTRVIIRCNDPSFRRGGVRLSALGDVKRHLYATNSIGVRFCSSHLYRNLYFSSGHLLLGVSL